VKFAYGDSNGDVTRPRLIRSAWLGAFAEAGKNLALDPYHMLSRVDLPVAALGQPDQRILADRLQALLVDCAKTAACEEFGLLVGRNVKSWMKAPPGPPMREQPTARDALGALERYARYQDGNLDIRTQPSAFRKLAHDA
jgi:hypothetical protein